MSKAPSITDKKVKVASPNICQFRRNHPQPKDAAAPENIMQGHV